MYQHLMNLPIHQLEADKRRVEREIQALERQLQAEVDPNIDEGDPGLSSQALIIALLNNARQKAAAIERALGQAQSGSYGVCEDCGQPIDPERLKIFPQATLCVPCKGKRETLERQRRWAAA